jgi:CrcB protein
VGPNLEKIVLIAAGAVLGANARYWLGAWAAERWGAAFPYGTLLINVSGSLLIGWFMAFAAGRTLVDPRWRLLFVTGFLGAYTTFSTYSYESLSLFTRGQWLPGLVNALGSAGLGILAAALGAWAGSLM